MSMFKHLYIVKVTGPEWINANDHRYKHWGPRHGLAQQWRINAGWAAKSAGLPPMKGRVSIAAVILFPDRRRRDAANWYPTVKACIDGLRDAGVLVDDDDRHVSGVGLTSRVEPGIRRRTVELHLSPEEQS